MRIEQMPSIEHGQNTLKHIKVKLGRIVASALLVVGGATGTFATHEAVTTQPAVAETGGYPWPDAICEFGAAGGASCTNPSDQYDKYNWYIDENGDGKLSNESCGAAGGEECWDSFRYQYRNCTSYAAWRVNKLFQVDAAGLGHGKEWAKSAVAKGWSVDQNPEVGDIAQWVTGGGGFGHVAIVESVNGDGTVNISEYNRLGTGTYGTRSGVRAENYIDVNGPNPEGFNIGSGDGSSAPATDNTIRKAIHQVSGGVNEVIWFKDSTAFETWWRPGGAPPKTEQIFNVGPGQKIIDADTQVNADGRHFAYITNGTHVFEGTWMPGQRPVWNTLLKSPDPIRDIDKTIGPNGEEQMYILTDKGADEYFWRPWQPVQGGRLYSLANPVAMQKTIHPDGTQSLYVADRTYVYENNWKGAARQLGKVALYIPQADITDISYSRDADGKNRIYAGREYDGVWEAAWYLGASKTTRQIVGDDGVRDIEVVSQNDNQVLYVATRGGAFEYWWPKDATSVRGRAVIMQQTDVHSVDRSTTADGLPAVYVAANTKVYESWWGTGAKPVTTAVA